MAKIKTSKKQKKSLKGFSKFKIDKELITNKKLIAEVLKDALFENDPETFRDVLVAYLRHAPKVKLAKETGLGRRTLYDLIENKKFDPRLSTIAALLSKIAA